MALGAQRFDILSLVLLSVLGWIATGLTVGAVLSFITSAFLRNLFAAFGAGILSALGAAVVILVIVGVIATLLPAYRAASIQPVEALRNE
jgi:ABC-type antimicrobial peptide transport system permease subunit